MFLYSVVENKGSIFSTYGDPAPLRSGCCCCLVAACTVKLPPSGNSKNIAIYAYDCHNTPICWLFADG